MSKPSNEGNKFKRRLEKWLHRGAGLLYCLGEMIKTYGETVAEHTLGIAIIGAIFLINYILNLIYTFTNWLCGLMTQGAGKVLEAFNEIDKGNAEGWICLAMAFLIVIVLPALGKKIFKWIKSKWFPDK